MTTITRRHLGHIACAASALLALAACKQEYMPNGNGTDAGSSASATDTSDIQPYLDTLGFNEPLTFEVNPASVANVEPNGIRHFYFDGTLSLGIVSLLVKTGRATPVRDPSNQYGWRMAVPGYEGPVNLQVNIGTRVITGRADKRTWTDGPREYSAETITYILKRSPDIAAPDAPDLGPYSFRLVLLNNPAVGQWQVDPSQTEHPRMVRNQLLKQVSDEGIAEIGLLTEKILQVRDGGTAPGNVMVDP